MNNIKIIKQKLLMKTLTVLLVFSLIFVDAASSMQGNSGTIFTYVATQLQTYIASLTVLSRSIAGIVGCVGAVKVYFTWSLGDKNITKAILAWGSAMLFLHIVPLFIQAIIR